MKTHELNNYPNSKNTLNYMDISTFKAVLVYVSK